MHDAFVVDQVETESLGFAILALPALAPSPALLAARPGAFGRLRATEHDRRIDGQHHDGPPLAPGGRLGNAILDIGRIRTDMQHLQRPGPVQHVVDRAIAHRRVGELVQQLRG